MNYVCNLLENEKKVIQKDNERLDNMIKTCNEMIAKYESKKQENYRDLEQIDKILKGEF